jgi:hypothetical protein
MMVSRVLVVVVFAISGFFVVVQTASHAGLRESQAQTETRAKSGDLQLAVELGAPRYRVGENPSFTISLRNSGNANLLLNGGELLGNGAEIWSTITCEFQAVGGHRLPLSLSWGVPGVAGRIYFLGVPLRAGSAYTVSVMPTDYYVGTRERLPAGMYALACTYTGMQSNYRDATQLPRCWDGQITSNIARVEVTEANR